MTTSIRVSQQHQSVANKPLIEMNLAELDEYFSKLNAPTPAALKGKMKGKLYSIEGLRYLPLAIRVPIHRLLQTALIPWKGKVFHDGKGANLALSIENSKEIGFYNIEAGETYNDHSPAVVLDYDVPENPVFMWNIRGELKEISTGYYLARMLYIVGGQVFTVLYFSLEA